MTGIIGVLQRVANTRGLRYLSDRELSINPIMWVLAMPGILGMAFCAYATIGLLLELEILGALFMIFVGVLAWVWTAFCIWTPVRDGYLKNR